MKVLNAKTHGIIDYLVVFFLWISPSLFSFSSISGTFTYTLCGVHLLLTIFTNFRPGVLRVIPLKVHGWIELVVSVALTSIAYYFHTLGDETGHYFYLCFAAAVFLIWLLTDYGA